MMTMMMILMKIIWIDDDHLSPYSSCPSSLQELAPPLLPTKPYKGVLGCFFIFYFYCISPHVYIWWILYNNHSTNIYLSPLPQRVPYDGQPCRCQVFSGWQRPAVTSRLHLNSNMTKTHTKTNDVTTNQTQLHIFWIGIKYTWVLFLFLTLNRY